jgi:hypothetical protein
LDKSVLQIKTEIVGCHTADSKPVKQEVNGTVILPPLVFPGLSLTCTLSMVAAPPVVIFLKHFCLVTDEGTKKARLFVPGKPF